MKVYVLLLGCLVGLPAAAPSLVHAQPRAPVSKRRVPAQPRVTAVLLVERGRPKARATLVTALRTQLARRGVRLSVLAVRRYGRTLPVQLAMARRAAALRGASVAVWFSLTRSVPLFVYFVEGASGRLVMRSFGDMEADERAEAAAIVVQSAVLAYERGERPGTDVATLPRTLAKMKTVRSRRKRRARMRRVSLELGYGYAYDDWDAELTGLHNVHVQVAVRLHPWWSLTAGYQWSGPVTLVDAGDRAEVLLRPHRFALGVRWGLPLGRWQVGAGLYVTAELVDYTVRSQPLVTDLDVRPLMLFSLVPCFHVGLRLFDRLRLVADLGLEVELRTPTLSLGLPGTGGDTAKLGRPEVVRPRLLLALAVDLF